MPWSTTRRGYMFSLLKKLFGSAQERKIKSYRKIVYRINDIDENLDKFPSSIIGDTTRKLKERAGAGEPLDDLLPEAYALVKNACRRLVGSKITIMGHEITWEMVPFDVQIIGAIAMHFGHIAEMQTGEGKTLTAALPLYLNSLSGKPVHIVTVNDYLAQRDCEWNKKLFESLEVSIGFLSSNMNCRSRKEAYANEILYGTASEFGFDYLRDNSIAIQESQQVQRGRHFAIIDEIDFVLIDDARTPLRISGHSENNAHMYDEIKDSTADLVSAQKRVCNKMANTSWDTLNKVGATSLTMDSFSGKRSKEEEEKIAEAIKTLWIVSKGTPKNKILKLAREHPFIRTRLDKQDLQSYSDESKFEINQLEKCLYIIVDEKGNDFELTDLGIQKLRKPKRSDDKQSFDFEMLDVGYECALIDNENISSAEKIEKKAELYREDGRRKERAHSTNQLLRAHLTMEKDVDYIVSENKVIIIDENTGRAQPGRRYSDGLHQAIEAKEMVEIQKETITYATVTLQNYFKMYQKLSGMSGTANTDAHEFREIYGLEVLSIPTRKPCIRIEIEDAIFMTEREKYAAIIENVREIHSEGRPILIGTRSVDESEKMSRTLRSYGLTHNVLNAKNHAMEADIIRRAGELKAITISTNMAGRGTDIKLGKGVSALGGLHVIGGRHFSRRNDRQLIGRCARQGDPGSSMFFGSFEDDLIRLFASPRVLNILGKLRPPEGEAISAKMLTMAIETAQKRIEQKNFSIRKHTLEFDNVISAQREEIYNVRQSVLISDEIISFIREMILETIGSIIDKFYSSNTENNTPKDCKSWIQQNYPIKCPSDEWPSNMNIKEIKKTLSECALQDFDSKSDILKQNKTEAYSQNMNNAMKWLIIKRLDQSWREHLQWLENLKSELPLRTMGQKDPIIEFKEQSLNRFQEMAKNLQISMGLDALKIEVFVSIH